MKLRCLIIFFIISLIPAAYAQAPLPIDDPDALSEAIRNSCEKIVIHGIERCKSNTAFEQLIGDDFMSDDSPYEHVLRHIETGDPRWLKVADALDCCVDAGTAETLDMAIAVAFIHSPETILRRTPMSGLRGICTVPFWEPPKEEYDTHVKAVKAALLQVKDPVLRDKKAECRRLIGAIGPWHE